MPPFLLMLLPHLIHLLLLMLPLRLIHLLRLIRLLFPLHLLNTCFTSCSFHAASSFPAATATGTEATFDALACKASAHICHATRATPAARSRTQELLDLSASPLTMGGADTSAPASPRTSPPAASLPRGSSGGGYRTARRRGVDSRGGAAAGSLDLDSGGGARSERGSARGGTRTPRGSHADVSGVVWCGDDGMEDRGGVGWGGGACGMTEWKRRSCQEVGAYNDLGLRRRAALRGSHADVIAGCGHAG
eukprot:366320-Chlamydomonas_euryale.AAC.9